NGIARPDTPALACIGGATIARQGDLPRSMLLLAVVFFPLLLLHLTTDSVAAAGVVTTCQDAGPGGFDAALAGGGNGTFNCGANPPGFIISQKLINATTTIDASNGGNPITLSGGNNTRLFV